MKNDPSLEEAKKKILLTRPKNLYFERYVFRFYQGILDYVKLQNEKLSTLEHDLKMLEDPTMDFEMRMAITYRSERKIIIRSQIHLVAKVQDVLKRCEAALEPEEGEDHDGTYRALILTPTDYELDQKKDIEKIGDPAELRKWLQKWEYDFYWRRLINADYFKYIKRIIIGNDFL